MGWEACGIEGEGLPPKGEGTTLCISFIDVGKRLCGDILPVPLRCGKLLEAAFESVAIADIPPFLIGADGFIKGLEFRLICCAEL